MFDRTHCAAVVPCFNEAASVRALVPALRRHVSPVVVVDDGSTDGTGNLARAAGAEVVRHERNLGKGAALRSGMSWARQRGHEWAVTLDGDGQHVPEDLPAFFRRVEETGARLVIGNRMHEAQRMTWQRRYINRWMSRQLSRHAGMPLPDTQCGLRLIHLTTWSGMAFKTEHFEVESELLMAFLAAGQRVEFVPIQVVPSRRHSHIRPTADTWRWLKWFASLSRRSASPSPNAKAGCPLRLETTGP